ncbi:MAG: lysophospholipid acyltransferase family protein [Hyphomonas sp.]
MKSILRSELMTRILGRLIWAYMVVMASTVRWQVEGLDETKSDWVNAKGVVLAGWHSQILMLPSGWRRHMSRWTTPKRRAAMLVSLSRDGEAVARAVSHLDIDLIRGSASNKKKQAKDKGGVKAVAEASRHLKAGGLVCITPDGPRGPREIVSAGTIMIAQRSGASILPYSLSAAPRKRLSSWDRFVIPAPFAKGAIVYGPMLTIPRDADPEAMRIELQARLDTAQARADELVGVATLAREPEAIPTT